MAVAFDDTEIMQTPPATAQWNGVTPRSAALPWLVTALKGLFQMARLRNNWDGYGSPPIQLVALDSAQKLIAALKRYPLPEPSICPVSGGGIAFTWQYGFRELEIEILPDGSAEYLAVQTNPDSGQEATNSGGLSLDHAEHAQRLAAWLIRS